jgi:hypothetical protein
MNEFHAWTLSPTVLASTAGTEADLLMTRRWMMNITNPTVLMMMPIKMTFRHISGVFA